MSTRLQLINSLPFRQLVLYLSFNCFQLFLFGLQLSSISCNLNLSSTRRRFVLCSLPTLLQRFCQVVKLYSSCETGPRNHSVRFVVMVLCLFSRCIVCYILISFGVQTNVRAILCCLYPHLPRVQQHHVAVDTSSKKFRGKEEERRKKK